MKKLIALTLALVLCLGVFAGCSKEDEQTAGGNTYNLTTVKEGYLTVITSPDYAPYEFYALDKDGNPTLAGFDMSLAQYIADYLGLTLEVVPMDFNGIIGEMQNGKADLAIAGLSPDPDRQTAMDFSDTYYEGKQAFITTKANADKFTDLASTNSADFTIAAQSGTIQMDLATEFSADAEIVTLTKATDIITELLAGQIDGAYVEWDVAESYQKNYTDLVIVCEVPYEAEGNVIGVKKGNADLLKYVNEALNKCIDEGTFANYLEEANNAAAGDNYQGMLDEDGKVPTEEATEAATEGTTEATEAATEATEAATEATEG